MAEANRISAFFSSKGRANRTVFWWSVAWIVLAFALAVTWATLFGDNGVYDEPEFPRTVRLPLVVLAFVPMLVVMIRFRGVCVRRRRDARVSTKLDALRFIPYLRLAHLAALGFLPSREDPLEEAVKVFGDTPAGPAPSSPVAGRPTERREPTFR